MSRYIDAEEFAKKVDRVLQSAKQEGDTSIICAFSEIFDLLLASAPTEDVEKVKHGQWLDVEDKNGNEVKICSHCAREGCYESTYEESFDYDYNENCYCNGYDEHREYISTKYCPWCGAEMDL